MSWSVSIIGKPAHIALELTRQSETMSPGQCKIEFDAALPYLLGILGETFVAEGEPGEVPTLKLMASGHGSARMVDGRTEKQLYRNCSVSLEQFNAKLV